MNTENNILIAEFLGWKFYNNLLTFDESLFTFSESNVFKLDLKFHSSWDWLMPVVEKIETLFLLPDIFIMYDSREDFKGWYWSVSGVKDLHKECSTENKREKTKIEATYNAVIEFIKWYNENSAKKE